jgi:hypothetical protein
VTWGDVLDNWELFALDLADLNVDVWDRELMRSRPGVWLRSLVTGLLSRPPIGYYVEAIDREHERRHPIWPNRVQQHFYEPRYTPATSA